MGGPAVGIEACGPRTGGSELEEEDELGQEPWAGLRARQVSEPVMKRQPSAAARQVSGRAGGALGGGYIREELEEPEEERPVPEEEELGEPCWLLGQDGKAARQESDNLSSFGSPGPLPRQETEMHWPSWGAAGLPQHAGEGEGEPDHSGEWPGVFSQVSDEQMLMPMASLGSSGGWQNAMASTALQASCGFDASLASAAMAAMQDNRAGGVHAGVPSPEWASVYTVMMRNLPNKYTQQLLLEELNDSGFLGTFDFLYLPIDPDTMANKGYAFISFISPASAWLLRLTYEGRKMSRFNSDKVVSVSPAALQGFEANYAHYSTARVSRGDPALRPLFLRESATKAVKSGPGRRRGGRRSAGSLIDAAAREQHQRQEERQATAAAVRAPALPGSAVYFGLNARPGAGGKKPGGPAAAEPGGPAGRPPKRVAAKFCPYCGGAAQPEHKFCKFCGASMQFD